MDYGPPKEFAPLARGKRGVGWHPHRGFETVTLAWEGAVAHRDNAGHAGVIGPGDVAVDDRRRAASSTRSTTRRSSPARGGRMHMMQLWVNLPAQGQDGAARLPADHRGRHSARARWRAAASVRVIAGEYDGARGPAHTFTPITMLDVRLPAGGELPRARCRRPTTRSPSSPKGACARASESGARRRAVLFANDGDRLELTADEDDATSCSWPASRSTSRSSSTAPS